MKRFFVIYAALILAAGGTAYGSLANCLNSDVRLYQWGYYNNNRNWLWVYSGPTTTNSLYMLNNGRVTGLAMFAMSGRYI